MGIHEAKKCWTNWTPFTVHAKEHFEMFTNKEEIIIINFQGRRGCNDTFREIYLEKKLKTFFVILCCPFKSHMIMS